MEIAGGACDPAAVGLRREGAEKIPGWAPGMLAYAATATGSAAGAGVA